MRKSRLIVIGLVVCSVLGAIRANAQIIGPGGGGGGPVTGCATSGTSLVYGNGSGGCSNATVGSGLSFSGGTLTNTGSNPSGPPLVIANNTSTGTTANDLTIQDASGNAEVATTTTTQGLIGIVTSGAGTSGNATIQVSGNVTCNFDGATTKGDTVTFSTSTGGDCHDSGGTSAVLTNGKQVVGIVQSTNGSAGAYTVALGINPALTSSISQNQPLQFYADQCNPSLANDGTHDDAANLRTCMANMPTGSVMNLDGLKPYFFASHSTSDSVFGSQPCETYLKSGQRLYLNGATITQSSAEVAITGPNFMVCAGSPNFNNPGSSGGSPIFDNIANTVANQTFVTLATPSHASNYNPGDWIYIDCGSNVADVDVFVGWDEVSDNNTSTGVLNLKYPMLKPYNYTATGCGSGATSARIYDWTTSGGGSSGYNLGPLAHDVYIEGPGTLIQQSNASPASGMLLLEGTVRFGIDYITAYSSWNSQFLFSNNNHLGTVSNDVFYGWGCGGDTNFNAGEFTSSIDTVDHDKVTLSGDPGVGCGATSGTNTNHEIAFGDSEGDESIKYNYDTAMVHVGLSTNAPNLLSCWFSGGIWGETIDHMECQMDNGTNQGGSQTANQIGILDTIGATGSGALVTQGPIQVTNSHVSAGSGNGIQLQVQDDLAQANTLDCTNSAGCLSIPYWPGHATSNTINMSSCSGTSYGIGIGTAQSSTLVDNHIHDISGTCSTGIHFNAASSSATLVMNDNQIDSTFSSLSNWSAGGFAASVVTNNPGIPDYNGSGNQSSNTQVVENSYFGGPIGACYPVVPNGAGVYTPGAANATGVVGFASASIPALTNGTITTRGSTCANVDSGGITQGDLVIPSPTNNVGIHDVGSSNCSSVPAGAQVLGFAMSTTASGSGTIYQTTGICPSSSSGSNYVATHTYTGTGNPTCTTSTGTNPTVDLYLGTLTSNGAPALPSSGCINNDRIMYDVSQGASAFTFVPTGTINASSTCTLGGTAGNEVFEIFNWNGAASAWSETCGYQIPSLPASVAQGGTNLATLTQYYLMAGAGTSSIDLISPTSNSGYVLTSNGASAYPTFQAPAAAALNYTSWTDLYGASGNNNQMFSYQTGKIGTAAWPMANGTTLSHCAMYVGSNTSAAQSFTATVSGTNMTVSAITGGLGVLNIGMTLVGTGITTGTYIVSQTSGTTGSTGVYVISASASIGSGETITGTNTYDIGFYNTSGTLLTHCTKPYELTSSNSVTACSLVGAPYTFSGLTNGLVVLGWTSNPFTGSDSGAGVDTFGYDMTLYGTQGTVSSTNGQLPSTLSLASEGPASGLTLPFVGCY